MGNYSLRTQAAYLAIGKLVGYCIQIITPIILVRLLTMKDYGIYRQILFISVVALLLMRLKIPQSLYYFFPRVSDNLGKLLSQTMSLVVLASSAGTIVFLIVGWVLHFLPPEIGSEYVLPLAIHFFLESSAHVLDHLFILEKRSKLVTVVAAGNQALRLFLVIGAIAIFNSVLGIVYALIAFSSIRLLVVLAYLMKNYVIHFGFSDRALLSEQIKYIAPLAASHILAMVGTQIDKGIIVAIMSPEDFAIYSVGGIGIMTAIAVLYLSVGDVCLPRFGELAISGDFRAIRYLWHKMVVFGAIITVPVTCFCYVYAERIITFLFTAKYVASADILRVNLLILFMQMLGYGYIPRALGKTKAILIATIARAILTVPLSFLLITKLGLIGGAISFVAGFWLSGIIQLRAARKAIGVTTSEFLPWGKLLTIFVSSATPAFILPYVLRLELSNFGTLLTAALIYFTVVGIAFKFMGYIQIREFKNILKQS